MTEIKLYVININGKPHEISEEVYNRLEDLEKQVKELKEHLQVKKLADSPIIAMIDNKPVHQDEYEALEKLAEKLKTANYQRQSKIEKLEDEYRQALVDKATLERWVADLQADG